MRIFGVLLLLSLPLVAQERRFTFGITGGVPLGSLRAQGYGPTGNGDAAPVSIGQERYTAGLSFEAYFNDHLSVDFNPLYRRSTAQAFSSHQAGVIINPGATPTVQYIDESLTTQNYSIQMPVVGKYTFRDAGETWRPFVGAGFGFQTAWQNNRQTTSISQVTPPGPLSVFDSKATSYDSWATFDSGAVFSAGVRLSTGRFQFVPEFRYTRWGAANNTQGRNAPEILVTFRF
jgi:hypothetical protein